MHWAPFSPLDLRPPSLEVFERERQRCFVPFLFVGLSLLSARPHPLDTPSTSSPSRSFLLFLFINSVHILRSSPFPKADDSRNVLSVAGEIWQSTITALKVCVLLFSFLE